MRFVIFLLSTVLVCAQSQDIIISRTERQTCSVRLVRSGGETPHATAVFVHVRATKRGADSTVKPIPEISGAGCMPEIAGLTPDSSGVVIALTYDPEQKLKEYAPVRYFVLRATPDGTYSVADVDGSTMDAFVDVVKGARMVHRGENSRPIANLPSIDLKAQSYIETLSKSAFAVSGAERLTPMWQLFEGPKGAETILTYGYDEEVQPTVQVVRIGVGPLRRLIFQRGAIIGVSPADSNSPTVRVFDESRDSARYARVICYVWDTTVNVESGEGRYVPKTMAILSACVIPPKRFAPFPLVAKLTRSVRLGFAPGSEGCSSSRHTDSSWPFDKPLDAGTPCEILATANDAANASWHFIGVRVSNDPVVRRLFGDHGTSESEQILTGGWVPANALETMGLPGVAVKR